VHVIARLGYALDWQTNASIFIVLILEYRGMYTLNPTSSDY